MPNWRVSQLTRLGFPGPPAEIYVDRIDWHQVLVAADDLVRTTSGSPLHDARESEPEIR
jgi:hypothetical protein